MAETEDYAQTPEAHHTSHEAGGSDEITIPSAPPEAHAASHQDAGADEIDCTGLAGRINYVDRGDPAAADWFMASLVDDGTWYDLDCSAIVPAGATAIHISAILQASASSKSCSFRKKSNVNSINILTQTNPVANIPISLNGLVACDEDRIIQYNLSAATWAVTGVVVRGWLI